MTGSAATVADIRKRHQRASTAWMTRNDDTNQPELTAQDPGQIQQVEERVCVFDKAHNPADVEFLACAHGDIGFLLSLVERATQSFHDQQAIIDDLRDANPSKNYAANAAILSSETPFRRFLTERHDLTMPENPDDHDDAVNGRLRYLLGIESRKQLNTDPNAAEKWRELRADYQNWERGS